MFKPLGERNAAGFYGSFSIDVLEGQFASTDEQRVYNASTKQCPDCRGWGYTIQRKGRIVERDAVGCQTCGGLGKLPRE